LDDVSGEGESLDRDDVKSDVVGEISAVEDVKISSRKGLRRFISL
jgi:hypothetical protein